MGRSTFNGFPNPANRKRPDGQRLVQGCYKAWGLGKHGKLNAASSKRMFEV
jgi:hypothetical protein